VPREPAGGQRALGRQPAEGGARPAAPSRRGRVPARRADARDRRRSKAEIYALIDGLALAGKAILIVSSYLPELLGICDRVAVMHRGRLGATRPASELTEHAVLMEAMGEA